MARGRSASRESMGCLSSKEVKDASVSTARAAPVGDHGSLVDEHGRNSSASSAPSNSASWGESRPKPQSRRFLDDGPGGGGGMENVQRRRANGTAPVHGTYGSDDELEAQMHLGMSRVVQSTSEKDAAALEKERQERKAKKKRDKNRVTDLEAYDLETEDPETKTEMVRRRAERATQSRVMKKVFADVDDLSDEDFSPQRSPTKGMAGGAPFGHIDGGTLITGKAVRNNRNTLAPLGGDLELLELAPNTLVPPIPGEEPLEFESVPDVSAVHEPVASREEDTCTGGLAEKSAEPEGDDFVCRDDEREAAPAPAAEPEDFTWRDNEETAELYADDIEKDTRANGQGEARAAYSNEDPYAENFEVDGEEQAMETELEPDPEPEQEPKPEPDSEPAPDPTPEPELHHEDSDAGDIYASEFPASPVGGAGDRVANVPPEPPNADDGGWSEGGFDGSWNVEAAGEADVHYDDVGDVDEDDDVF